MGHDIVTQYVDELVPDILSAVKGYDFVVLYADFRFLVSRPDVAALRSELMSELVARLSASGQTFLTPSYSYTDAGQFEVMQTRTNVSALAKWLVGQDIATRSEHPIFSYVGFGPGREVLESIGKSAFGAGSVYDRLRSRSAGFLHLGRPMPLGNSMIHHVEHLCGATYRMHKAFKTEVLKNGVSLGTDYSAFVRRRDIDGEDFAFDFSVAAAALKDSITVLERPQQDDHPYLASYSLPKAFSRLVELFEQDAGIFINSKFRQY